MTHSRFSLGRAPSLVALPALSLSAKAAAGSNTCEQLVNRSRA